MQSVFLDVCYSKGGDISYDVLARDKQLFGMFDLRMLNSHNYDCV